MAKKVFLFEDDKFNQFLPLTYNRPVYELLCGATRIREKISSQYPDAEVILLCRDYLEGVMRAKTGRKVNDFDIRPDDQILLVNGRILPSAGLSEKVRFSEEKKFLFAGDDMVAWSGDGKAFHNVRDWFGALHAKDRIRSLKSEVDSTQIEVKMVSYLWDLVSENAEQIESDFARIKARLDLKNMFKHCQVDDQALIYDVDKAYTGRNSVIEGQVVLDARGGPIIIEEGVKIQSHTRVEGPSHIGAGSILVGGEIRAGTSMGPCCRVGGEVEESIFLGYCNKYHEGFLGHSYAGEWVNLGALTTNSNLKNNYGSVRVMVNHTTVDSGQMKVGAFIGDHAKTGIGTLLNTGVCMGFASNVFGGGMLQLKYVPSFFWGSVEKQETYRLEKAVETARTVMRRRGRELSDAEVDLFKKIFQLTEKERRK